MPTERIRRGWHPASDMTIDYEWRRLPRAADQRNINWTIVTPSGFFNEVDTIIGDTLDRSVGELGGWNGSIFISNVTPGMIRVLRDEIWQTDGLNEQITIVHYVVGRGWMCLQGWGRLRASRPGDIAEPRAGSGVITNFRIDFDTVFGTSGGEAPSGGGFSATAFSSGFDTGGIPD